MRELYFDRQYNLTLQGKEGQIHFDLERDLELASVRQQFNSAIAAMSPDNDSLAFNQLRITERNTLFHTLFEDTCYLLIVEKYRDRIESVTTSRWFVFRGLLVNGFKAQYSQKIACSFELYKKTLGAYKQTLSFLITQFFHLTLHRLIVPRLEQQPEAILISYASDRNFDQGRYEETYFGDLANYLNESGIETNTCVLLFNVKKVIHAFKVVAEQRHKICVLEDFITFNDLVKIASLERQKHRVHLRSFVIGNFDLTETLQSWLPREHAEISSAVYLAIKQLGKKRDLAPVKFYHHFENMVVEKVLNLAVEKHLPDATCIGYFHTTKPNNLLCLEPLPDSPLPAHIVFNAKSYASWYQARYPSVRCVNGYAFKQARLEQVFDRTDCLLVLLTGITAESLDLLERLAASQTLPYPIYVRAHPMNPIDWQRQYSLQNWLGDEALHGLPTRVIGGYSGALVEYAMLGSSVGLLASGDKLTLNPFDDTGLHHSVIQDQDSLEEFLNQQAQVQSVSNFFNLDQSDYSGFIL